MKNLPSDFGVVKFLRTVLKESDDPEQMQAAVQVPWQQG
jgi:hypothetical protein